MAVSLADTDLDDDHDFGETHEINVTPFIDVILVLLRSEEPRLNSSHVSLSRMPSSA